MATVTRKIDVLFQKNCGLCRIENRGWILASDVVKS
jgi:hypothetical protein